MRHGIRIVAISGLLAVIAGGIVYLRSEHHAIRKDDHSVARRESAKEEDEGPDAPEFVYRSPDNFRPTRWRSLDDAGANHRCNQDGMSGMQNETPCAASPADPEVIVVGANDYRSGTVAAGYYRTTDGGNTWQDAFLGHGPDSQCQFAGDPSITADATGKFYAIYCAYYCTGPQGVYAQTSTDNGSTWTTPVAVGVSSGPADVDVDKPMSACDVNPDSPYLNYCYAAWMDVAGSNNINFSRSTNGGVSFSTPVRISANSDCWCPSVTVGPNGEVYVLWMRNAESFYVEVDRSTDGGVTWRNNDIRVASAYGSEWLNNPCGSYRMIEYPSVACDISHGPYRGSLYACWNGTRGAAGDDGNIYVSRSTDGGLTWSDTVRVNDDNTTRMQWWPWISVHPRTGDVGISWLDRRNDPANCNYQVYGTVSADGGHTWATNFRISDQTLSPGTSSFLGDYTGATFSRMGFQSSWADTRNDVSDAYSAWWNNGDSLALTSPNGGETFAVQQPCSVRWHFRYAPDSLIIALNRNYPSGTWDSLTTTKSDSGYWVWHPTEPSTSSARMRVVGQHFPTIGDTSDANFAIGMATPIHVTAYRSGNDIRIAWQGTGALYYHVYSALSWDGPYNTLEGSVSGTVFLDLGAASEPIKYYIVKASTEP